MWLQMIVSCHCIRLSRGVHSKELLKQSLVSPRVLTGVRKRGLGSRGVTLVTNTRYLTIYMHAHTPHTTLHILHGPVIIDLMSYEHKHNSDALSSYLT